MHRTKDESYLSSNEAAVLRQLRNQKLSASSERLPHWNRMEKKERKTRSPPVRIERICSQEGKFILEEVRTCPASEQIIKENESEIASLLRKSTRFMEISIEEICTLLKICSQRKGLMEIPKKEARPH